MPTPEARTKRRRIVWFAGTGGAVFIFAAMLISVFALASVRDQQTFLCGLLGQSVIQQKASLDARVSSLKIFAAYDASPIIRAYQVKQVKVAEAQAKQFLDPKLIDKALTGHCATDIANARQRLKDLSSPRP